MKVTDCERPPTPYGAHSNVPSDTVKGQGPSVHVASDTYPAGLFDG